MSGLEHAPVVAKKPAEEQPQAKMPAFNKEPIQGQAPRIDPNHVEGYGSDSYVVELKKPGKNPADVYQQLLLLKAADLGPALAAFQRNASSPGRGLMGLVPNYPVTPEMTSAMEKQAEGAKVTLKVRIAEAKGLGVNSTQKNEQEDPGGFEINIPLVYRRVPSSSGLSRPPVSAKLAWEVDGKNLEKEVIEKLTAGAEKNPNYKLYLEIIEASRNAPAAQVQGPGGRPVGRRDTGFPTPAGPGGYGVSGRFRESDADLREIKSDYDQMLTYSPLITRNVANRLAGMNSEVVASPESYVGLSAGHGRIVVANGLRWEGYARMREGTSGLASLLNVNLKDDVKRKLDDKDLALTDNSVTIESSGRALIEGAERISQSASLLVAATPRFYSGVGRNNLGRGDLELGVGSFGRRYVLLQGFRALDTAVEELDRYAKALDGKEEGKVLVDIRQPGGAVVRMPLAKALSQKKETLQKQRKERQFQNIIDEYVGIGGKLEELVDGGLRTNRRDGQ